MKRPLAHKTGATSFYVVAISTLILVILATSFATAMMAEVTRSSNDDIAESAYDSALAGIEEAKLAYENYRNCLKSGTPSNSEKPGDLDQSGVTCEKIVWWMEHPDCDMVAHILGRIDPNKHDEVQLERIGSNTNGSLDQAYTCVTMETKLGDTYGRLNNITPYRIINVENINPKELKAITLSWHFNTKDPQQHYPIIDNNKSILFASIDRNNPVPTPAIISLQIVQTTNNFTLDQLLGESKGSKTNRATMFFVPNGSTNVSSAANINYIPIYNQTQKTNILSANDVIKTNNPEEKNKPYLVYCNTGNADDFACSVTINLPSPLGNDTERSNDTFKLLVSAPYGGQDTIFAVSYDCGTGNGSCNSSSIIGLEDKDTNLNAGQVIVDSTGRAGDMYKRIEARLDPISSVTYDGFPFYAIQADIIEKNITVTNEPGGPEPPEPPDPEPKTCDRSVKSMQEWIDGENGEVVLGIGQTKRLRDDRDDQCYIVTKLSNGEIWMSSNLNLIGDGKTELDLNKTDIDLGHSIPSNNGWGTNNKLPLSSTIGFTPANNNYNYAYVYNSLNVNPVSDDKFSTTVCGGAENNIPCSSYYSWDAATLGSGRNISNNNDKASYSICPYGWRLPTSEDSPGNSDKLLSGYYSNGFFYEGGEEGYYWTSTAQSSTAAQAIQSTTSNSSRVIGGSRSLGYAVRCVYVEPVTHTLTIERNDGTNASSSISCIGRRYGCSVTIPSTVPTRKNYAFDGYALSADASPTDIAYNPGDTYTFAPGVTSATIYAVWHKLKYTIEYYGNGGATSGGSTKTSQEVEVDTTVTLTPNPFRRSGYVFQGWATSPTGSVAYADRASVKDIGTPTSPAKLYAVWRAQYRVTYNLNGGSGTTPASQTVLSGNSIQLPSSNGFSRTNYYFDGWLENDPSFATVYNPGSSYPVTSNVTFYAKWVRETYQIIFNGNGGARNDGVTQTTQTANRGDDVTLVKNPFVRSGYSFQGWATSPTGSVVYGNEASVKDIGTPAAPAELYAVWEEAGPVLACGNEDHFAVATSCPAGKICYAPNGTNVEGTMGDQSVSGNLTTLLASNYSTDSCGFAGWSTDPNAGKYLSDGSAEYTDIMYGPNETIDSPDVSKAGLQLYAIWVPSVGTMQTWNGCDDMNVGGVIGLTDERDGDTYAITKIAGYYGGNKTVCWMIENLRLDPSNPNNNITKFNTNNPDVLFLEALGKPEYAEATIFNNPDYDPYYSSTNESFNYPIAYDLANVKNRAIAPTTGNDEFYSYGAYYSRGAALAGNTRYFRGYSTTHWVWSLGDICPVNWGLPNGTGGSHCSEGIETKSGYTCNLPDTLEYAVLYNSAELGYADKEYLGSIMSRAYTKYPYNYVFSGIRGTSDAERMLVKGSNGSYMNNYVDTGYWRGYVRQLVISRNLIYNERRWDIYSAALWNEFDFGGNEDTIFNSWIGSPVRCVFRRTTDTIANKYTIRFDGNGGQTPTGANTTNQVVFQSVVTKLTKNPFIYPGYKFIGWNTRVDGSGRSFEDEEEVSWLGSPTEMAVLYAQWERNSNPCEGMPDLQNWNKYSSLSVGDSIFLRDSRDNQCYQVAKLEDDNIWMIDNLNLGDTENYPLVTDLNSTNTNINTTITKSTFASWKRTSISASDTGTLIPISGIDAISRAKYGTLYNYYATSGGTISETEDAIYDICPSGWRLPTGGEDGEYQQLYDTRSYNSFDKMRTSVANDGAAFPLSGLAHANVPMNKDSFGAFWTSTNYSHENRYVMRLETVNGGRVMPNTIEGIGDAISVRCILARSSNTYDIVYYGNGGATTYGATTTVQIARRGIATNLVSNPFIHPSGYEFQGWATSASGPVVYADGASVTNIGSMTSPANLYAIWEEPTQYIQDLTLDQCKKNVGINGNAANIGDNITVYDKRDGKDYTVRYINGYCWMTQNLRITGTIKAEDSNFTGYDMFFYAHIDSGSTITGVWYNYQVATANTIYGTSNASVATQDICPAGWHLPSTLEAWSLGFSNTGKPNAYINAFGMVAGGYYLADGGVNRIVSPNQGNYWTNMDYSNGDLRDSYRYVLVYDSSANFYHMGGNQRENGCFIRCVRRA